MSAKQRLLYIPVLFCLLSLQSKGQTASASPYSRYGIGDLESGGFIKNLGFGGIGYGYNPAFNLNILNPASAASLALTTFETGVNLNQVKLQTSAESQYTNSASLSYFAFGFPVKYRKWGTTIGLLPYSNVGYSITDQLTNAHGDAESHTYEGSGGLNQFIIGNGFSPFKNLSLGVNASYLFGVIGQQRRIEYPELLNYFNTRVNQQTSIGSLYFNFGMQLMFDSLHVASSDSVKLLNKKLKSINSSLKTLNDSLGRSTAEQKTTIEAAIRQLHTEYGRTDSLKKHLFITHAKSDWSLTLGGVLSPNTSLNAAYSILTENFVYSAVNNALIIRDTVQNISGQRGKLVLPMSVGGGVTLRKGSRWLFGADFFMQQWENYSLFGVNDSLANSWRVSAGIQFTPNDKAIKSYWQNVQYRLGFHYEKSYLQIHNSGLNEKSISLGLGLPVRRSAAMLHFAAEAGKRGTTSNNLIQENFLRLSIGFTLNDRWFIKEKIN